MGRRLGSKLSADHIKAVAIAIAAMTPEARQRRADNAGRTMAGRPQRLDTVCGKHTNNKSAKWWKFENKALGKTLEGKNLNQLVRDNETLFDPADLQLSGSCCNAAICLRSLKYSKSRTRDSWKGWVICTPMLERLNDAWTAALRAKEGYITAGELWKAAQDAYAVALNDYDLANKEKA